MRVVFTIALLSGCSQPTDPTARKPSEDPSLDTGTMAADTGPAPLAELTDPCPIFATGDTWFTVKGVERHMLTFIPADLQPGAPVVFVWHGRTQEPSAMDREMGLEGLAERIGAIVFAPSSLHADFDVWGFEDNDWAMVDALRTCAVLDLDADIRRIHTTGFSAGGYFVARQVMFDADLFASAILYSAGTDQELNPYQTPAWPMPVLVSWGVDGDEVTREGVFYDFPVLALDFADHLAADAHPTVVCPHPGGHKIADEAPDIATHWFAERVFGEAFVDDLSALPTYCAVR